jgi:hypothetical protein
MDIITYALAKKIGSPSEAQIESAVDNYLDAHPEATTTVQDGSITKAKLNAELSGKVDEISDINERLGKQEAGFSLEDFTLPVSQYEHGTIDQAGNNSIYKSASRVRTISPTAYPFDLLITMASDTFQVSVALYESDGTFISISSTWRDSIVVPAGAYFRIMVHVVSETETATEIFAENILFKSFFASAITENLEKKIIKFDSSINEFDTALFEKGTIDQAGNNSTYRASYRARSNNKTVYDYDLSIVSNDGFQFCIITYEADGTFIAISPWEKSAIIPANTYFRIMISTLPETTSGDPIPLATLVGGIGYAGASAKATEDTVLDYANDNILLPSYYDTYIKGKAADIQSKAVRNGISFAFITDVHVENNAGKSPALIKYLAGHTNCVPFVIFGGDVPMDRVSALSEVNEQANKWISWVNAMHVDHVYQCIGNHDYHGLISEDGNLVNYGLSQNLVYNYVMGRQMLDVHAPYGEKYYYFDIIPSKTRIVVLDCYDTTRNYPTALGYVGISEAQLTWLVNEAFGNIDGYSVIVVAHQTFDTNLDGDSRFATAFSLIKAFANKTTFTSGNVSADFTQNTNTFVMHLAGHAHYDGSHVSDNVLSVLTTCDARYTGVSIDSNRVIGTVAEQAFDVFTIDYDTRTINATRIGYGADREFTY